MCMEFNEIGIHNILFATIAHEDDDDDDNTGSTPNGNRCIPAIYNAIIK